MCETYIESELLYQLVDIQSKKTKKIAELQAGPPSMPTACVAFLVSRCRNLLHGVAVSSGTCAAAK